MAEGSVSTLRAADSEWGRPSAFINRQAARPGSVRRAVLCFATVCAGLDDINDVDLPTTRYD